MATPNATFEVNAEIFSKCSPNIRTNIKQCGSVTICDAAPMTVDDLTDAYLKSGEFRVMDSLLQHEMEIKMCESVQNGLYDFMMANRVNLSHKLKPNQKNPGLIEIKPFIEAKQYSPINNEYWLVTNGEDTEDGYSCRVSSTTNIPADVRSFPVGMRVFIDGVSQGGAATHTAWAVVTATLGVGYVTLLLTAQNSASHLDPDKLGYPTGTERGIMTRGTPNVSEWEKYCYEGPAYLDWKYVPFWIETIRDSMCWSELYNQWRTLLLSGNYLYKKYYDLDEVSKNKQLGADWQKRIVRGMFSNKPLPNQTPALYDNLEDITTFDINTVPGAPEIGVDGGRCVGKRANAVGIYEQLAECNRVFDMLGGQLNIADLAQLLYNMFRVRQGNGHPRPEVFDLFMDSVYAELFNQAMLAYWNAKSQNMARLNLNGEGTVPKLNNQGRVEPKAAKFGFYYTQWQLTWPQGMTINIITHTYFDDALTAAAVAGTANETAQRCIWILDFTGIYPGIINSDRQVHDTGKLKELATLLPDFACVMRVPSQQQTLLSLTYTVVVECPNGNAVLENIALAIPDPTSPATGIFSGTTTTTTTTTTAPN